MAKKFDKGNDFKLEKKKSLLGMDFSKKKDIVDKKILRMYFSSGDEDMTKEKSNFIKSIQKRQTKELYDSVTDQDLEYLSSGDEDSLEGGVEGGQDGVFDYENMEVGESKAGDLEDSVLGLDKSEVLEGGEQNNSEDKEKAK